MQFREWPFYPLALLHDAARFLAATNQGLVTLNAQNRLQIGSVARLARMSSLRSVRPDPSSESQAPGLSVLIGLLGSAGLVASVGSDLRLTSTAYEWLALQPEGQIEQLRNVWRLHPTLDLRWLPPTRSRRSPADRWQSLVAACCIWVGNLSTETWTPIEQAYEAPSVRKLLESVGEGRNLPRVRKAQARRSRSMLEVALCLILPRLGIVEFHAATRTVRPTLEGATWLQPAFSAEAGEENGLRSSLRFPETGEPPVAVSPDLQISVFPHAPAAWTFDLAHFAELVCPGPPARYRVTRQTLAEAGRWGYSAGEIGFLLARFSEGKLPRPAVEQLLAWQEDIPAIVAEPGWRVRTADPAILDALLGRKPFRERTARFASRQDAWVSAGEAAALWRYLRRLGYALNLSQGTTFASGFRASVRGAIPLKPLLVAVRTYQAVCKLVPGMAELGLDDLQRDIETALSPAERRAVGRMVRSHTDLLKGCGAVWIADGEADGLEEKPDSSPVIPQETQSALASCWTESLRSAIGCGTTLDITYIDTQANVTRRAVRPMRLESCGGSECLVAYCELRQEERRFRLDRIISVSTEETE